VRGAGAGAREEEPGPAGRAGLGGERFDAAAKVSGKGAGAVRADRNKDETSCKSR
jgi:hypothetical protein